MRMRIYMSRMNAPGQMPSLPPYVVHELLFDLYVAEHRICLLLRCEILLDLCSLLSLPLTVQDRAEDEKVNGVTKLK